MKLERGNFTIEATLVFPIIFLITIIIIIGSLYAYRQVSLYSAASVTAKRSAYIWDNSSKNFLSGAYYAENQDDLYWRIFDDQSAAISFPSVSSRDESLQQRKLMKAVQWLPNGTTGTIAYSNSWIDRRITVTVQSAWKVPAFLQKWIHTGSVKKEVSANVNEPVEFIRNMNLVSQYMPSISSMMPLADILGIWSKFRGIQDGESKDKLIFATHAEAKLYLQKLVKGHSTTRSTDETGVWRLIDAFDQEQIAHQAYLGQQDDDHEMLDQMNKDVELMKKGIVKGVVWHYFRKSKDGSIGPSEQLRKKLERNGIVIVIYK